MKFTKTVLFIAFIISGCGRTYTPDMPPQDASMPDASAPDAQPYPCRSDCECDLNYCDQMDLTEGRWDIVDSKKFVIGCDGAINPIDFPYTDSQGCMHSFGGTVSFIADHYVWNGYFHEWFGQVYSEFNRQAQCGNSIAFSSVKERYWYWGICEPGMSCGMAFYNEEGHTSFGDGSIGGDFYGIDDGSITMIYRSPNFWGVLYMSYGGFVGDCDAGQLHCYQNDDCTDLIADCVTGTSYECHILGGRSYSRHANAGHYNEPCRPTEIQ